MPQFEIFADSIYLLYEMDTHHNQTFGAYKIGSNRIQSFGISIVYFRAQYKISEFKKV